MQHQMLCWVTHGSTLAGTRRMSADGFHGMCGSAYVTTQHLALATALMTMRHFGHMADGAPFVDRYGDRMERWLTLRKSLGDVPPSDA